MRVAVDISLYPLADDFISPIDDVITRLNQHDGIAVATNAMSTQLVGDYADVMAALNAELKRTFDTSPRAVFTIKILNNPINI